MKTIINKLLNDIYMLIGKIFTHCNIKSNHIYDNILNILFKTREYLENTYYEYCLKPKLEKEFENEKKIKDIIILYLLIINYNNYHQKLKLITYPGYGHRTNDLITIYED